MQDLEILMRIFFGITICTTVMTIFTFLIAAAINDIYHTGYKRALKYVTIAASIIVMISVIVSVIVFRQIVR